VLPANKPTTTNAETTDIFLLIGSLLPDMCIDSECGAPNDAIRMNVEAERG
jgi:hypothetical protein